jgi:hypothetical protein
MADGPSTPPVKDAATAKECSACHMPYPAGLLPARSWTRLMSELKNHFGENAELDDAARQAIAGYLTANAADRRSGSGKILVGLSAEAAPLRISELPWFLRKHEKKGRTAPDTLKRRGAKSPADCRACHPQAERGQFDDD